MFDMASARCALGRISPKNRPKIRPNQLKIGLNWYKSYVIKVIVMALRDPCFQTERNQPQNRPKIWPDQYKSNLLGSICDGLARSLF